MSERLMRSRFVAKSAGDDKLRGKAGPAWRAACDYGFDMSLDKTVLRNSAILKLSYGAFRVLSLDAAVAAKEAVGCPRDLEAARQLRALRERMGSR